MRRIALAAIAMIAGVLSSPTTSASSVQPRQLTFEDRVRAQGAIERVFYSHQIGATRTFEEAVPQELLEQKVRTYLKQSMALEHIWQRSISAGDLSAELERMVRDTRDPGRLSELFEALGNDPILIQECLARALLVDRLARDHYASEASRHDQARLEAEILHEQLATGQISLVEDEPHRSVVEVPADAVSESLASVPPGSIGDVIEEPDGFTMSTVMEQDATHALVTSWFIPKVSWDAWWASVAPTLDTTAVQSVAASVAVPALAGTGAMALPCGTDDVWRALSSSGAPSLRSGHSAVWTGSHMIIWGGGSIANLSSGGRYDPATDSWSPTSMQNAPEGRSDAHAVWTGDVMIIWGGTLEYLAGLATGGRYDPVADRWTSVSTIGAPIGRLYDENVAWIGSAMIIWGGRDEENRVTLNTGGRYDPVTDTWTPTAISGAPSPRQGNTMVWTGSRLLVWGGACYTAANGCSNNFFYNTGGLYDPVSDSWQPMTTIGAPNQRVGHGAVWTGSRMVVWGGSGPFVWTGTGQYDPATNTWLTHESFSGEPPPRDTAVAVWTGSRMVVWGGQFGLSYNNTGGRYDPDTRTWTPTSLVSSPTGRVDHTMVWTGREVLLWGGYGDGGTIRSDAGWAYTVDLDEDGDGFKASCECDDSDPATWPGAAEVCDGADNDCDGATDEELGSSTCGVGACLNTLDNCVGGVPQSCVPGTPTSESCNGLDDDCDGSVDEGLGPVTLAVDLDPERLWPPNHRMVDIHATVSLTGGCSAACPTPPTVVLVSVTSSEPDDVNGAADGQTDNDIQDATPGSADFELKVRAERDGTGTGRFYELVYASTDCLGDTTVGTGGIFVPHDEGGKTEPVVLEVLPLQGGGTGSYALQWNPVAGADTYNVMRGRLSMARVVGSFTVIEDSQCLASSLTGTSLSGSSLAENPAPGEAFFYLTEYVKGSPSGYGTESSGRELIIASGDPCH